jgi:hypothetical protein
MTKPNPQVAEGPPPDISSPMVGCDAGPIGGKLMIDLGFACEL